MSAESTPTQAKHRSIMPELGRHSFIYTVGNLLTRSVGFVMLPLYTRFLTPQEFGVVELTELTVSVVTLLVGVGAVGGAMNRIYHEYKRGPERDAVISTSMWSALCLSFIIFVAGSLSAPLVARQLIHDGSLASFVALSFVAVVASTQIEVALVYVRIQERSRFFVAFSVVYTLAQMLGNVFFIVYGDLGMWGLLYSKLLVGVTAAVLLSVLNIRSVGWAWSRSAFDRLWHFGRPLVATSVAFFIIHFADRWFIAAYATTTDVGLYAVGYKFGFLITFLVGEPFGRIWNAKVFAYASRPNWKEEFARVFTFFFAALAGAWVCSRRAEPADHRVCRRAVVSRCGHRDSIRGPRLRAPRDRRLLASAAVHRQADDARAQHRDCVGDREPDAGLDADPPLRLLWRRNRDARHVGRLFGHVLRGVAEVLPRAVPTVADDLARYPAGGADRAGVRYGTSGRSRSERRDSCHLCRCPGFSPHTGLARTPASFVH